MTSPPQTPPQVPTPVPSPVPPPSGVPLDVEDGPVAVPPPGRRPAARVAHRLRPVAERLLAGRLRPLAARRPRPRPLVALLLCALLVGATGLALGRFDAATSRPPTAAPYPVDLGSARWVRSEAGGAAAWFRTTLSLPDRPTEAVLWLDADQTYQVWVNGRRGPSNRLDVRASAAPQLHPLDLRAALHRGDNAVGVQVTNADGRAAALVGHLVVRLPDGSVVQRDTGPDSWQATADASAIGAVPAEIPAFTTAPFVPAGWTPARVQSWLRTGRSPVPQTVMERPVTAVPIGGAPAGDALDTVLRTHVDLAGDPSAAWLRLAVRGSYEVTVDGRRVDSSAAHPPADHRDDHPVPLNLLDVTGVLHSGRNELAVHVWGIRPPRLVLDGTAEVDGATTAFSTGAGWTADDGRGTVVPAVPQGAVRDTWPYGFQRLAVPTADAAGGAEALFVLAALALWLAAGLLVARARRWTASRALRHVAAAFLPVSALLAVLAAYARFPWDAASAFPYERGVEALLLAVLATTLLLTTTFPRDHAIRDDQALPERRAAAHRRALGAPARLARRVRTVGGRTVDVGTAGVLAVAAGAAALFGSQLNRDPLWQDELVSLIVARTFRERGLPELPSGLHYFKGELYHVLLAAATSVTTDVAVLRALSLLAFVATVLVFGLMLLPTIAPGRPAVQVVATALFALAPMESTWSRDIRMYQTMQLFSVLFVALLLRALTEGRRRQVVGSAVALLAMYLSHEESFVLLPALPVLALVARRTGWWRRRIWYLAYGMAGLVVAVQYKLSKIHPVDFGKDLSNRSYVGLDPHQAWFYYAKVFFRPLDEGGTLLVLSSLAVLAAVVAVVRQDRARLLAAVVLGVGVASVSLLFTVKIERYAFVLVPLTIALGVVGGADVVDGLARLVSGRARAARSRPVPVVVAAACAVPAVLLTLGTAPGDYALAAARLTGTTTTYRHADYAPAADFVASHWRPGDVFVTLCPPDVPAEALGRAPDRIIATGRNKLLYLIERDGVATDTIYGSPVLLTGNDVTAYVHAHSRVWLVSDAGSAIAGVPPDVRDAVAREFHLAEQGAGSTVYVSGVS